MEDAAEEEDVDVTRLGGDEDVVRKTVRVLNDGGGPREEDP